MRSLVFVAEDHPVQQKLMKVHFEEMLGNYSVQTFSNPEEMLEHLNEKPFAIVLDHFFGDESSKTGLHYLKEIRKKNSSIPVIYYTTLDDEKVRSEVMALGADQYIIKNSASLVRLRTALDILNSKTSKKKGFLQRLFNR
jgi:CheY-like chemotaxis protein